MSSDLRLKKLRGSGGYIMASVDDDQQRKGNLGGPDLFLAPIGRIDNSKISKYFCNTCERDYEGAPNIDYENPNEEVADNLILVEKGQYVCGTCGSTLAEYREFKKPDEMSEVGSAKPMESFGMDTMATPYEQAPTPEPSFTPSTPEPSFTPSTPEPSYETPTEPAVPDFESQPAQLASTTQGGINSIVGMAVFDSNARKIGTAKQVGVDASQALVLVITKTDGSDVTVQWTQIKNVGEIILLGSQDSAPAQTALSTPATVPSCANCGFANKAGSKFCEQCGTKL